MSAVIDLQPDNYQAHRLRAVVFMFRKQFDKSLADWKRLTELNPSGAEPHYYSGVIHMGRRAYEQALEELELAIAQQPEFQEAYLARAQIHHWQGELEQALRNVNFVIDRQDPPSAGVLNDRAYILRTSQRLDDTIADFRQSIEREPAQAEAFVGLALVYQLNEQPEEADRCMEEMISRNAESTKAHLRLAEYYRNQGKFNEATIACDRARELGDSMTLESLVRASISAAQGAHAEATVEAARVLNAEDTEDGTVRYLAACVWSLAASTADDEAVAQTYADRAAQLLSGALTEGFHDLKYEQHNYSADDPALDAIREHPQLQSILRSVR